MLIIMHHQGTRPPSAISGSHPGAASMFGPQLSLLRSRPSFPAGAGVHQLSLKMAIVGGVCDAWEPRTSIGGGCQIQMTCTGIDLQERSNKRKPEAIY